VKSYRLQRNGNLLWLKAAVGGISGETAIFRLLVDTGASYTTLPTRPLESLGYSTTQATQTLRLISASGMMSAPVVTVSWFNCLGIRVEDYPVISYTLPTSSFVDGILGMDFLIGHEATIATATAEIRLPL